MTRARGRLARLVAEIRACEVGLLGPHIAVSAVTWGAIFHATPLLLAGSANLLSLVAYEYALRHPSPHYICTGYRARQLTIFALSLGWLYSVFLDSTAPLPDPARLVSFPLRLILAVSSILCYLRLSLEPPDPKRRPKDPLNG